MCKEKLLSTLNESESVESATPLSRNSFDGERLKKIRKDFNELRDKFSKPQMKEIRKNLYDIKNFKKYFNGVALKTNNQETKESLFKLEERLFNFKKYRFQDDFKYRNIGDITHFFNRVALNRIDENYYKPIRTKRAFDNNYIEFESKGDKDKNLLPKEYLDMIRPYLGDIINDHKAQFGELKMLLAMSIFFLLKILMRPVICMQRVIT